MFQQDNVRPHIARVTMNIVTQNNMNVLSWSSNSPYLNSIEHIWDELYRSVRYRQTPPQSLDQFKLSVSTWMAKDTTCPNTKFNSIHTREMQNNVSHACIWQSQYKLTLTSPEIDPMYRLLLYGIPVKTLLNIPKYCCKKSIWITQNTILKKKEHSAFLFSFLQSIFDRIIFVLIICISIQ
jgi:hypothetical protein